MIKPRESGPHEAVQVYLDKLEVMAEFPRFYLANYFSDIRTEVDLVYGLKQANETDSEILSKINREWLKVINKVDQVEAECLRLNLRKFRFNNQTLMESIRTRTGLLNENKKICLLKEEINKLEKILFNNKTVVYLKNSSFGNENKNKNKKQKVEPYEKQVKNANLFEKLIIINDEYFSNEDILNIIKR